MSKIPRGLKIMAMMIKMLLLLVAAAIIAVSSPLAPGEVDITPLGHSAKVRAVPMYVYTSFHSSSTAISPCKFNYPNPFSSDINTDFPIFQCQGPRPSVARSNYHKSLTTKSSPTSTTTSTSSTSTLPVKTSLPSCNFQVRAPLLSPTPSIPPLTNPQGLPGTILDYTLTSFPSTTILTCQSSCITYSNTTYINSTC
jgi:hypothetical protein